MGDSAIDYYLAGNVKFLKKHFMILHLIEDEKFIDSLIDLMEIIYPQKNDFFLISNIDNYKIMNIHQKKRIKIIKKGSIIYDELLSNISKYKVVIIHFMTDSKLQLINNAPHGTKFVWNIWGMDFYSLLSNKEYPLYDHNTYKLMLRLNSKSKIGYLLRKSIFYYIYVHLKKKNVRRKKIKIYRRIKFYTTVLPEESNLIQKFIGLPAKYIDFNYCFSENPIRKEDIKNIPTLGKNILLGNSGTPTNNHLDIMNVLENYALDDKKITSILSYGNKKYIEFIIDIGKKKFSSNFEPVLEYMTFSDYLMKLKTCNICIMGHYRQQGIANLLLMIWSGAKVYISKLNPFYQFCLKRNIKVYTIENDLKSKNHDLFKELSKNDIMNNKQSIYDFFGYENVIERNKNFIHSITN